MERKNDKFYMISLSFSVEINSNTPIELKLVNFTNFVSDTNALPQSDTLSGNLYHYSPYASVQAVEAISSKTSTVVQTILWTSLALSFISPNPASFWSTLNVLDYISCLGLTEIPMSDSFYTFVKNMNSYHYLPNFFEAFMDENQGTKPYDRAKKYGYDSDLLLLNTGSVITILGIIFTTIPIAYFLTTWKYTRRILAKNLERVEKIYKYSIFVRFWIQTYLDISVAALIGLLNFSFRNVAQITNSLMCLGIFIFSFLTPSLFFMLSFKNKSKAQEKDSSFSALWGSFFYEF